MYNVMNRNMVNSTLELLVDEFAQNVALQTDCIWRGDSKTGNKHAKRYIKAFEQLRLAGNSGRDALTRLFEHESPDVRATAAAFLLRYRTKEAQAVLKVIANSSPSLVAFEAQQALTRWEEGTWALDPP
jgi:Domain of unknown function (DUF2019)